MKSLSFNNLSISCNLGPLQQSSQRGASQIQREIHIIEVALRKHFNHFPPSQTTSTTLPPIRQVINELKTALWGSYIMHQLSQVGGMSNGPFYPSKNQITQSNLHTTNETANSSYIAHSTLPSPNFPCLIGSMMFNNKKTLNAFLNSKLDDALLNNINRNSHELFFYSLHKLSMLHHITYEDMFTRFALEDVEKMLNSLFAQNAKEESYAILDKFIETDVRFNKFKKIISTLVAMKKQEIGEWEQAFNIANAIAVANDKDLGQISLQDIMKINKNNFPSDKVQRRVEWCTSLDQAKRDMAQSTQMANLLEEYLRTHQ